MIWCIHFKIHRFRQKKPLISWPVASIKDIVISWYPGLLHIKNITPSQGRKNPLISRPVASIKSIVISSYPGLFKNITQGPLPRILTKQLRRKMMFWQIVWKQICSCCRISPLNQFFSGQSFVLLCLLLIFFMNCTWKSLYPEFFKYSE